jgi:hypothetical protein
MLTAPLWIASVHWSRSIINRDSLWPVVDQPEPRLHKDDEDGRR